MNAQKTGQKPRPRRIDAWLSARGFLSKTGLVLLGLALLLTFISFTKGIQVLMFIPAFVIALFVYSFFDVFLFRKKLEPAWQEADGRFRLLLVFHAPRDFCRFLLVFDDGEKPELLRPDSHLYFRMPDREGQFSLILQGKFDIFRVHVPVPPMPKMKQARKPAGAEAGEMYFSLQPYEDGDELKHIDAMQTAKRNMLYIRKIIHEAPRKDPRREKDSRFFQLQGTLPLSRKENVASGRIIEWVMILTAVMAVHLEWRFWIFTLFALFSIAFVLCWLHLLNRPPLGRKMMNTTALLLFIGCFIEGGKLNDTVLAGAHFLVLLAIWKHLFIRERRDAFTYIFLVLFVFVALSLSTMSAWFMFLFFVFLLESIALFTNYSAGEREEEFQRSFERPPTRGSFIRMNISVILATVLLFFVLPHGNRAKDTSLLENDKKENKTGFSEDVSLNDMRSIKRDFSKKFIVESAEFQDVAVLRDLYWRGMRFADFDGGKWKKPDVPTQPFRGRGAGSEQAVGTWVVRYYPEGDDVLFVPAVPVSNHGAKLQSIGNDPTLLRFWKRYYNDVSVEFTFLLNDQKRPVDPEQEVRLIQSPKPLDSAIIELMSPFWDSLPAGIENDPEAIARHIRDSAGFSYSLEETSPDLQSFLYDRKQGHCEYFATVLALTLQHFGYPAVYVNGFQGGEWNEGADVWLVRGIHAHSWVEVFDPQIGWSRLDSTPPSSETFFRYRNSGVMKQLVQMYDTIELRWFEYVVSYTGDRQRAFFYKLYQNRDLIVLLIAFYAVWKVGKRGYRRFLLPHLRRSPKERFLWWLKRKTGSEAFVLQALSADHPALVRETREQIFGGGVLPKDLRGLRKKWSRALRNHS